MRIGAEPSLPSNEGDRGGFDHARRRAVAGIVAVAAVVAAVSVAVIRADIDTPTPDAVASARPDRTPETTPTSVPSAGASLDVPTIAPPAAPGAATTPRTIDLGEAPGSSSGTTSSGGAGSNVTTETPGVAAMPSGSTGSGIRSSGTPEGPVTLAAWGATCLAAADGRWLFTMTLHFANGAVVARDFAIDGDSPSASSTITTDPEWGPLPNDLYFRTTTAVCTAGG